jgi:hypothetical protein
MLGAKAMQSKKLETDAKRAKWNKIIDDFNASGQNQTQYCKQRNINKDQFCYYLMCSRKSQKITNLTSIKSNFIPLEVSMPNTKWVLKMANGLSLELPDNVTTEQVSALLVNLRGSLC